MNHLKYIQFLQFYIDRYYGEVVSEERIKQAMEDYSERG
jgi:hypothetical protein